MGLDWGRFYFLLIQRGNFDTDFASGSTYEVTAVLAVSVNAGHQSGRMPLALRKYRRLGPLEHTLYCQQPRSSHLQHGFWKSTNHPEWGCRWYRLLECWSLRRWTSPRCIRSRLFASRFHSALRHGITSCFSFVR